MTLTKEQQSDLEERLNVFRTRSSNSECYGWIGILHDAGHPRISFFGKSTGAARAAWLAKHGTVPEKHYVLHSCKNKDCTNIDHLYLSTQKFKSNKFGSKKNTHKKEPIENA